MSSTHVVWGPLSWSWHVFYVDSYFSIVVAKTVNLAYSDGIKGVSISDKKGPNSYGDFGTGFDKQYVYDPVFDIFFYIVDALWALWAYF